MVWIGAAGRGVAEILRLNTGYVPAQVPVERPVSKKELGEVLGVSTRTIDRWIAIGDRRRGKLPQDTVHRYGCWVQAGCHRRFYVSRVRQWWEG